MFLHYVKNPSYMRRVVLYIDVIRKHNDSRGFEFINVINNLGIWLIDNSLILNIFIKNQHKHKAILS